MGFSPGRQPLFLYKWQARVGLLPRGANPNMLWILRHRQRTRRSRQKIQVIHVIAGSGNHRVESAMHQDCVTISRLQHLIAAVFSGIQMLNREAFRLLNSVVIDFIQINFARRIVHVMLVRRIARPVPSRRINLNYHELISRKRRSDNVYDLARSVPATPQAAYYLRWSDQFRFQSRLGRHTAFRNLTNRLRSECYLVPWRQIERVRKTVENVPSFSNALRVSSPTNRASPPQEHEGCFLLFRMRSKFFTGLQTPHKKTHPFPLSLVSGQMKELTALSRRQFGRMDERGAFAHVSPVFLLERACLEEQIV